MSARKRVDLLCDAPDVCTSAQSATSCHIVFDLADSQTVAEARASAAAYGWRYVSGRDLCPACVQRRASRRRSR